ncbi:VanZ family protein [Desulfuromonas acetoxidans]|uniref:VanZ-like domain-containing protein n=1 Tax=Desulfuromonas acetoxidans (strain DSM 684 / 11070) TaxID=281689 RepID=Q1K2N2_DESA6|nr:conserved hypothetical protein [Desulfuromonas acetoxidans DSM 684]MBF0644600.1 VanZ family protein [Desulfuromonas acetoxidans]NVD23793.1 VanZ family protein [Desulfuromonas acetoxidans]NVE15810.1 VanZ family protein [Desulfuromonas acetoxidans]
MTTLINIVKTYWISLTLLVLTAITLLSLWPLDSLPAVPGTDKTHHFIAYACLMLPTALRKPTYWRAYGVFFIAYSGAIELIQPYVNRYGEWMDLFANSTGVLCGVLIAELITFITSAQSAE